MGIEARGGRGFEVVAPVWGIVVAVGATMAATSGAAAAETDPVGLEAEAEADSTLFDLTTTFDWSSRYFAGGLLHGAEGILLQPGAELGLTPDEDLGLRLFIGGWASLHQNPAGADGGDASAWHEADAFAGAELDVGQGVAVTLRYTAFTSPNDSFDHVHELAAVVAWDDAELWSHAFGGRFGGLQPALMLAFDAERTDFTTGAGVGAELGFEPSLEVIRDGPLTLAVSLPLVVGFGMDGDGESVAAPLVDFAHAGLTLTFGLGFVPESAGAWSAKMTARVPTLGARAAGDNGGERALALASFGLEAGF